MASITDHKDYFTMLVYLTYKEKNIFTKKEHVELPGKNPGSTPVQDELTDIVSEILSDKVA